MATAELDDLDPSELFAGSHYDVLGVSISATPGDIQKAYRQRARCYHPDKNANPNSEEWMKRIVKAFEVLSDRIERAKYDEHLQDEADDQTPFNPAGALPPGRQLSVKFMEEVFSVWLKTGMNTECGQFSKALKGQLAPFLQEQLEKLIPNKVDTIPPQTKVSPYSKTLDILQEVAKELFLPASVEGCQVVTKVLEHARTSSNKQYPAMVEVGTLVPILDFSRASSGELRTLFDLFSDVPDNDLKSKELLAAISKFVPQVSVQDAQKPEKNACTQCRKQLLKKHAGACIVLPRLGHMRPQNVCDACRDKSYHQDMEDWMEAGLQYLKAGGLGQLRAALGCFTLALCSCPQNSDPLIKLARELLNQGAPELGLPLLSTLVKESKDPGATMKAHLLAASSLKSMADRLDTNWHNQWQLLFAAKEACILALSAGCTTDELTEAPELDTIMSNIDSALHVLLKKKENDHTCLMEKTLHNLERAWDERDWDQLLSTVTEERDYELAQLLNGRNYIIEALEQFVAAKQGFLEKLLPEDRYPLIFLRGVVNLQKGNIITGLKDLEAAAWNSHHARWLTKEIIEVLLTLLPKHPESILPLQAVKTACKSLANRCRIPSTEVPLFPNADELLEPPKIHWEELIVPDLNIEVTRKYELSVTRQVQEGKLTEQEAALAYIDYCLACNHPAETAVCFLTASLWFLRALRKKASKASKHHSELYALKNAVRWCLERANTVTRLALHPGMHLYISRLGLVAMLHAAELVGDLATPEDSKMAAHFLEVFTYNCRFCPFWHAPIVTVSEAVLLHIFTGRLHSEFTLGLQHIQPDLSPVSTSELRYQLYENDLRHLHSLDDSAKACSVAMEEMLLEKGWYFEDVVEEMTSPLSPRTDEGWLVKQPKLGTSPEYAQLAGFVLDLDADKSSIQLLLVPASHWKRRVGLFSRADIDTVLQLDENDLFPIFFSLDPPNSHQYFHPFQQVRYMPDKLYGTDLLHTLFETDYLLKSFSVGSEVSSNPPFNQRPCSNGLTADLPPHLREVLKPIAERGPTFSHVNRFWIQAEELVYSSRQTGTRVEYHFADPVMAIRSHPQLPGMDGLQDTGNEHDPDSPEAKFAAGLTSHYTELGQHFPMFARLQELVKLQFFGMILNGILKELKEKAEGKGLEVTDQMLHDVQTQQRKSQMAIITKMLCNINKQVQPTLNWSNSSEIQSQVVDALMKSRTNLSRTTLSAHVSDWLSLSNGRSSRAQAQSQLATYICSSFPLLTRHEIREILLQQHRKRYKSFHSEVEGLKEASRRQAPTRPPNCCNWVPAALRKQDNEITSSLCYGGVLIAPKFQEGRVQEERNAKHVKLKPQDRGGLLSRWKKGRGDQKKCASRQGGEPGGTGGVQAGGLDDPRHRWGHIFVDRPGHVNPKKEDGTPDLEAQEEYKKLFIDVLMHGDEVKETWTHTEDQLKLKRKHGDKVKVSMRKLGQIWVQVWVYEGRGGYISSAGVNYLEDKSRRKAPPKD